MVWEDSGLGRAVMEDVTPGRRGREQPIWRWTQDVEDTLGMRKHRAGGLAICRESFGQAMNDVPLGS